MLQRALPASACRSSQTLDGVTRTAPTERLIHQIAAAFPGSTEVPNSFIEANPDISGLTQPVDLRVIVPAYMIWCVRNADEHGTLIPDFTVEALAEFGRAKNPEIAHLNFKHTCSPQQRAIVAEFLRWCLDPT